LHAKIGAKIPAMTADGDKPEPSLDEQIAELAHESDRRSNIVLTIAAVVVLGFGVVLVVSQLSAVPAEREWRVWTYALGATLGGILLLGRAVSAWRGKRDDVNL
jgi:hypothetical protein